MFVGLKRLTILTIRGRCVSPLTMIGSTYLEENMRKLSYVLAGALVSINLFAQGMQPPKTPLKEGDMAPDFTLTATTGPKVTLSEFRGKFNVVLAFFPAAFTGG